MGRPKRVKTEKTALRAANMAKFREKRGWSQWEASRFSGISIAHLIRCEDDDSSLDADKLGELARLYGHRTDDFQERKPPPMDPALVPAFVLLESGIEIDPDMLEEARRFIERLNSKQLERLPHVSPQLRNYRSLRPLHASPISPASCPCWRSTSTTTV